MKISDKRRAGILATRAFRNKTTPLTRKTKKPSGFVIYKGPSQIDGKPIVCIATMSSKNSKTANMIQTWILRADIDPITANRIGADYSICGDCPHRGIADAEKESGTARERSCYVSLIHAPRNIYASFHRGIYPEISGHDAIAELGVGRMVRLGSYGDGDAVPSYILESLISRARGFTSYSHQSRARGRWFKKELFMVSADTLRAAKHAWKLGRRTFRIISDVSELIPGSEILCPASKEAGQRTTCESCGLCAGSSISAKSIAIVAHGNGATHISA